MCAKTSPAPAPLEGGAHAPVESGVAELVVEAAFLLVGEDLVGLVDLFERRLGGVVSLVSVRVVLQRELLVGAAQLLGRSFTRDPQDLVEAALG